MKTIFSFPFCLIILSLNTFVICVKLNERRILLPFNNGVNTNFTLEATNDNCYQWSSSRLDVASVEPLDESKTCSRKALVTVVSTIPRRQSTVVTATNTASGSVIRCDVEIDVIDSIEIITTTREIVLEDLPEILEVKAKDDKNDTFTSIGGIQFEWTLSPVDVLRYRTWSSSSYVGPPYVHFWESREAKGPVILVEGIRTGSAKVTARIVGDHYKSVKAAEIELHVIANLGLIPPNVVYLIRGSKIQFKAEMAKQGPKVALTLPSPQYYLKVLDPTIAQLDEESSQVEALEEGNTSLLLLDRNVASGQTSRHPMTDIHVMRPSYLSIHVTPGENFALCEFTSYVLSFTLHDEWHHRIYPAENLILKVNFPSRYFHVNESSANGTFHVIRTINSGNCKITAQLIGAGSARLAVPLELQTDVTVYRTLVLTPYLILLPWIPSVGPSYTVFVNANGATGQYRWGTNNSLVATVTYKQDKSSRVTVVTRGEGEALINCQDVHNSVFSSNMRVSIQPLVDIEILPAVLETHIGGNVILPIAVYGYESDSSKNKRLFDDCSQIPFDVEIIEKTRVRYDPNSIMAGVGSRSCRSLSFECISTGNTRVWIKYKAENGKELLSTTAIIGCHLPLRPVHPEKTAVLPLGGIIDVAFEGGPRAWTSHPEGHYSKLSSDTLIVSSVQIKDRYRYNKDLHVFRVKCLQYGETPLELDVGNLASPTLPNPASAATKIQILCSRPSSLIIKPKLNSSCPLFAPQDSVFPIEKNQNPEIEVEVRDETGKSFYNISTLSIVWKIEGTATFETQNGVKEIVNGAKGYSSITRNIQILSEMRSNSVKISAEITGYKKEFRDKFKIKSEIELNAVEKAKVDSDNIAIFNHPKQKFVVNVRKGSGYFSIDSDSERQFINISFKQQSKSFTVIPKAIGGGVIGINDLCLSFYGPTEVYYSVIEANDIRIEILDKFELGSVVDGYVSVIDNNGDYIHSSNHNLIDLVPIVSNTVLSVSNLTVFNELKSSFKVYGKELGSSYLSFVSQSPLISRIESSDVDIQIFAPLRIVPSNVTLIVGDHFQVTTIGGPQPQRNIDFSLVDEKVATVDSNGLIVGSKLGKTKLIARVLSVENIEYSRCEVELNVVALHKIKIVSPTSQLKIGSKLPIHLLGSNEFENPFSFGTSIPSLRITWSVSNDNIAAIDHVFQSSGVVDHNSISVRLRGISTGIVSIKVTVEAKNEAKDSSFQQIINNKVLSDTIQINVFPSFAIVSDGHTIEEREILMSPNSHLSLQSNRMGEADIQFELLSAKNVKLGCGPERCLKAGDSPEVSSLVVKTNEKSGVALTSVFGVRVDKISYLMINLINNFISGETIDVFPIGSESQIRITFHDKIGKTFDSIRSQIRWTLSRNDLIRISRGSDNTTLKMNALKEGRTLIKVFDNENDFFDYFSVDVGAVIEPNNLKISVGEVVCFHSKLMTSKSGLWSVENPSVGDIDRDTGVFVARNGGHTLVEWKSSDSLTTYTSIDVMPPQKFALDTRSLNPGITNSMSQTIPIVIINQNEDIRQRYCSASIDLSTLESIQSPFNCEIAFDNSLQIKSIWNIGVGFDMTSGQWLCQFDPKPDLNLAEMSLINGNVSISVIMSAPNRDLESNYKHLIHTITVPFLPAFDVSPKQLILSPDQSEGRISVHSVPLVLKELTVISSDNEIIETSNSEITGNSMKIIVKVKNWDIFSNGVSNLHISVNSKLTKQSQRIAIQLKLFGHNIQQISTTYKFFKDNTFTILSTILFGIVIIVFAMKYLAPKVTQSSNISTDPGSPFLADYGSPSLKGHRALNYTPTTPSSPMATPLTARVGRPLYSVSKT